MKGTYEFGEHRFDADKRVLWRDGELVSLPPKASEVLAVLIENGGNLVERGEILDKVWNDTFVEEANINYVVSVLRKSLGDNGVIQTIPRRGYRFTADLRHLPASNGANVLIERRTVSETTIETTESIEHAPALSGRRNWIAPLVFGSVLVGLVAAGIVYLRQGTAGVAFGGSSVRSIAVLPFKGFGSDQQDQELRLKITDSVITTLGSTEKLVVRPTSSVLRFAADGPGAIDAGRELQVDAVLDGRVQKENGRIRVNLQLVSVATNEQLWAEQFDGRETDLLGLQDAIARRFRQDLKLTELPGRTRNPVNSEAYDAYLKGRYLWNQRRKESYFAALDYFNKSVEIDPNFALGYTGISDVYHLLQQRNVLSTRDAFEKAEAAARRALELDANLAEAHVSMGAVSQVRYIDWAAAERSYKRAIELNPNLPEVYGRLGMLYNSAARFDDALVVLEKGVELDPTSLNNAIYLGAYYYFSKNFEPAIAHFTRILTFAPSTERAHFFLTRIYELQGRYDEAVEHALKERAVYRPDSVEPLRAAYQRGGIRAFWREQIRHLEEESKTMAALENHIASRYVLLGDLERACDYVEQNVENIGSMTNYGRVDPLFEKLWNHPRYIAALNRAKPVE